MSRAGDDERINGGSDRFSTLPDDVLVGILSHLTVKEAICTCVLSSRWKNLWKRIPRLDFDADEWIEDHDWWGNRPYYARIYILCVNRVLRSHKVHTLEEFKVCFELNYLEAPEIDDWIQFLIAKKVPRLDFDFYGCYLWSRGYKSDLPGYYDDSYVLSDCLLRSLKGGFKFLTSLSLKRVNVTGEAIAYLLRNAPFLDRLVLHGSQCLSNLEVCGSAIKLKHLEVCHCYELDSLVISAPYLTSLKVTKFEGLTLGCVPRLVEVSVPCYFDYEYNVFTTFSSRFYQTALPSLFPCLSRLEFLALRTPRPLEIKDKGMIPELPRLTKLIMVIGSWADQCLLGLTSLINASPKLEEFTLQLFWNEEGVPIAMQTWVQRSLLLTIA